MNFKIGQRVVCVKPFSGLICNGPNKGKITGNNPIVGEIYTITKIVKGRNLCLQGLLLDTLNNPQSFIALKFKPLKLDYNFVEEVIRQVQPKETI